MEACLVRFGVSEPFGGAAKEMAFQHRVTVGPECVRRHTEQAGDTYLQLQASADATTIFPATPPHERLLLSVDACKVQTTTGEWRDVKTLTVAAVDPDGKTHENSYFSRKAEYHQFLTQAGLEARRRCVARAKAVCAVNDGADWIPPVITALRPDALRILDFYHAAEHVATAGRAVFGETTPTFHTWFESHRHELKTGNPDHVLATLADLAVAHPLHAVLINAQQGYLTKRRAEIDYAQFKAAHWPIGSGPGEAAHKVVIQVRLKRAGMRWKDDNVDRMAALRNLLCNQRWLTDWPLVVAAHRRQPVPTASAPPASQPSCLPPGFTLRPAISWRNQPVGKARLNPHPSLAEKG